jgi:hypothetical protein
MLDDKDVQLESAASTIYDVYGPARRTLLLIGGAAGVLLSFCTSIYLPALKVTPASNRPQLVQREHFVLTHITIT